jgi:hypothetical protein
MIHDQIRIRTLAQRDVIDPASLLKRLAELNATDAVKRWRTREFKELREMKDACGWFFNCVYAGLCVKGWSAAPA